MSKKLHVLAVAVAVSSAVSLPVYSKQTIYSDGERELVLSGRAHFQYLQRDPENGEKTDDIGFRRLRVELDASIAKNWNAQIEWEFGEGAELDTDEGESNGELVDGYIEHTFNNGRVLRWGHTRVVQFSRSDNTSSNYLHQVERTLVGSNDSGVPGRQTGIGWYGEREDTSKFIWDLGIAMAEIDPANNQIDFDSEVNSEAENSEGVLVGGRVQYFPMGYLKEQQADFHGPSKWGFALAAFTWDNDGDQRGLDPNDPDIETVTGVEVSGSYRGQGWSIDAEYNTFSADAVRGDLGKIGGATIFNANGEAELDVYAIDAGYMLIPEKFQVAASYAIQDAEPYADEWVVAEIGATYFLKRQDIKFQGTYRIEDNVDGVIGNDRNTFYLQAQYLY